MPAEFPFQLSDLINFLFLFYLCESNKWRMSGQIRIELRVGLIHEERKAQAGNFSISYYRPFLFFILFSVSCLQAFLFFKQFIDA